MVDHGVAALDPRGRWEWLRQQRLQWVVVMAVWLIVVTGLVWLIRVPLALPAWIGWGAVVVATLILLRLGLWVDGGPDDPAGRAAILEAGPWPHVAAGLFIGLLLLLTLPFAVSLLIDGFRPMGALMVAVLIPCYSQLYTWLKTARAAGGRPVPAADRLYVLCSSILVAGMLTSMAVMAAGLAWTGASTGASTGSTETAGSPAVAALILAVGPVLSIVIGMWAMRRDLDKLGTEPGAIQARLAPIPARFGRPFTLAVAALAGALPILLLFLGICWIQWIRGGPPVFPLMHWVGSDPDPAGALVSQLFTAGILAGAAAGLLTARIALGPARRPTPGTPS